MDSLVLDKAVVLTGNDLTVEDLVRVARDGSRVETAGSVAAAAEASREALLRKLGRQEIIYGVSTGFGANVKYFIPPSELKALQENVLHSLCCGAGPELDQAIVRGAIVLRANALSKGYSAVRPIVIERLIALLNAGVTPIVPRYGSVGASGDLVPSAYIGSALSGEGEAHWRGERVSVAEALKRSNVEPIRLEAKEGLALVNGTTMMTSVAALTLYDLEYLARLTLAAVAMTAEALRATSDPFRENIHLVKNHPGQIEAARLLRAYAEGSTLLFDLDALREDIRKNRADATRTVETEQGIQTPYSLRCAPQGLGPALENLEFARRVVEREMNSVNDNPLIDAARDEVYHTGNFYGGHIARAMDGVKIDIANLANWAHCLMAMLMDPRFSNGLPASLATDPGLSSGFKGMQLAQTSLVVACRQMAAPSSIHTLPTEQYNQDIVSLGMHSAMSANDMALRLRDALSILLLALCQAVDLRGVREGSEKLGKASSSVYAAIRQVARFVDKDRAQAKDIAAVNALIADRALAL
ncbi:MAG TPA: aromatic amino acid ammonia-lyase [Roseiarcus sp.]|nr:aromatic amino acid ammonia-lyase [Roseiarcus sp.]